MKNIAKELKDAVRETLLGVISENAFWAQFDEAINAELKNARCYLDFDKSGIDALVVVGEGDAAMRVKVEIETEDHLDSTQDTILGISKTIERLQKHRDELAKVAE